MVDIVDLQIRAENLASERLVSVARDVNGLGRAAQRAQDELEQLQINQNTLQSFQRAAQRVEQLEQEIVSTSAALQRQQEEQRASTNVTDEQRESLERSRLALSRQRRELTQANREYTNFRQQLERVGVETENLSSAQQQLNQRVRQATQEAARLSQEYQRQTANLARRVQQQEEAAEATRREEQATEDLRRERQREAAARVAQLRVDREAAEEQSRLTIATARYEQALERLNRELNQGAITRGQYIRAEERLRQQLNLTSAQINTSRRAIEADAEGKANATRNTDALTTVTRRLAQAYTVLIAAQTSLNSVLTATEAYGQSEAAITNIARTTGLARDQVTELSEAIRTFATEITPTATAELNRYAEVAGQLGVTSVADLTRLVEAADQLGIATNIAGDEAATLLTRILGVTGQGVGEIGRLSSSVVELGNNFAAQESQIVEFTRQLVTSTREINLSAEAAAGIATALAVSGVQAEASRTAIGRLSQSIRQAVTQGGGSLQRLSEITGQTAQAIEQNLGGNSEQIILDFARGLERAAGEGRTTLEVLRQFGIDGQEAAQIFSALSANVDTLERAINSSNDAFADGNRQVIEAAQAYANQESQVGRLRNQFRALTTEIGRAFSDETAATLDLFEQSLDGVNDEVIELAEILPDVVAGVGELLGTVDNLLATFGTDGSGVFSAFADGLAVLGNTATITVNSFVRAIQNLVVSARDAVQDLANLLDFDIELPALDSLRQALADTSADIDRDANDIIRAFARIAGESSRSFDDLQDAIINYGDRINDLDARQRDLIATFTGANTFIEGQDQLYRQLTESLVRANRQYQVLQATEQRQLEQSQAIQQQIADETATRENYVNGLVQEQDQTENLIGTLGQLGEVITGVNTARQQENDVLQATVPLRQSITEAVQEQTATTEQLSEVQQQQTITAQELLEQNALLNQQYQSGQITLEQLTERQGELITAYMNLSAAQTGALESNVQYTNEQLRLREEIAQSEISVNALRRELEGEIGDKQELVRLNAELAREEQRLIQLRQQETELNQIANASYLELVELRRQTTREIEALSTAFQAGRIEAGAFEEQSAVLQARLARINAIIGEQTEVTEQNTAATVRNTAAKEEQAEAAARVTSAVSLEIAAYQALNQEFDFSSRSTEDLSARVAELTGFIRDNQAVSDIWLRNLAELSNQAFTRERQIINETLAVRELTNQVQNQNVSLERLNFLANNADRFFTNLGSNQLDGLRNAINAARQEFQALDDAINQSLDSVQDRLDRIQGNEADIVRRQFEREQAQLNDLLQEALAFGDQQQINRIREAIRQLQQAQQLEFDAQFDAQGRPRDTGRDARAAEPDTRRDTGAGIAPQTGANIITVQLQTPEGGIRNVQVLGQDSANNLLAAFEDSGLVSQQGNV